MQRHHVLIVEDSQEVSNILAELLALEGFTTQIVRHADAIEGRVDVEAEIAGRPPVVVVWDVPPPVEKNWDRFLELRRRLRGLKFVFTSAEAHLLAQLVPQGALLPKPYAFHQIVEMIRARAGLA